MKTKISHIILTICFLGSLSLSAQIKQANIFFEQFKYSKAIPLYKKATTNKDEKIRKEATLRLADCYRLINNSSEASVWYNKAAAFENISTETYFYLGTSLRSQAKYDEAEKAFNSYVSKNPSDARGKIYAQYCRDIKEWGKLAPCAEIKNASNLNSTYSDFGPVFYKNGIIFTSDRDIDMMENKNYLWTNFGYLDLYSSRPITDNDFWSSYTNPFKMPNTFNQDYHNGPASFTSDFNKIFITRTLKNTSKKDSANMRTNLLKIYYADLTDEKKINFKSFPFNNEDYSVGHPSISADGKKLIFSSDKPGGFGQSDLYISELVSGNWSEPVNLGAELNTFGNEVFPFLANDSTLYFSSDGYPGYGGLDIYETKLVNGKWSTPWNLKLPVNSPYDDFSIVFNKNLTGGFFSSNRPGGKGSDDIYAFRNYHRTPEKEVKPIIPEKLLVTISGYVKDKKTLAPLDSATIFLLNTTTNEVFVLKTNPEGYFETLADKGVKYVVKGMKSNFFDDCQSFSVPNDEKDLNVKAPRDLLLGKYAINQVFKIDNIYYDLNKWDIRDDAKPSLNKLVSILNQYPINVEIGSHTDCRASTAYNNTLSQKRAESAVKYLVSSGIDASRLTYKGYGETMLINKCADGVPCSEAEHQANRRTEFKIISINPALQAKKSLDLKKYKAGDKLSAKLLDADFFNSCMEDKSMSETPTTKPITEPEKKQISQGETTTSPAREIVKKTESARPTVAEPVSADNIWYAVQVVASTKPIKIDAGNFKGEQSIQERKIGNYFKYFSSNFNNLTQASAEQKRLKAKFPGAFIVTFKGDQPITTNQIRTN